MAFRGCSPSQWCAATKQQLRISLSAGSWHAAGFTYSLEGLFPSVRPDVIVERCSTSKGSAAVATLEGSVTGVRDDVVPQLRGLGEGLGAVTTLVGPAGEREIPCRQCIPWPKIRNHVGGGGVSPAWFFHFPMEILPVISIESCGCSSGTFLVDTNPSLRDL